ncbi:MAG: CHAT domain-containing protein, partial [Acidimicrobiia bacterium]
VHRQLGDASQARGIFMRVLAEAEVRGERPRVANSLYLLGLLDRDARRFADAEALQRRALALREPVGAPQPLIESLIELSRLVLRRGAAEEALELAGRAVTIASERRLRDQMWNAQAAFADAAAALNRPAAAIELYQASIAGVETLRTLTAGGDRSRQLFLGLRTEPYLGLARLHARAGRAMDGLAAIERARARTLLDVMASGRRTDRLLSDQQRTRERELTYVVRSAASELEAIELRPSADREQVAALEAKLARARLERDAFTAALYTSTPDLRIARGDTPLVTTADLNALVDPATAVVSLVLDNTVVWVYLITRSAAGVAVTVHQTSVPAVALTSMADRFSTQVAARDLGFAANARELYDALFIDTKIEPMLKGKSHLVIVPDGPLWRVPFQALRTPRDTFLIEERAVSYAPSVSALAALDQRRRSRAPRQPYLLAVGDPVLADIAESKTRGPIKGRLPQAAREVKALGQLYGDTRSRVLVAEQATESSLRENLGLASVIHVATHGVLDDISPMYSHVRLAPKHGKSSGDDGRLEAWELMNLQLDVDLAILSACETARGPVGDGEGVIGLSWSLFAAGASAAVVSQWEVDSASTTALMIAFHERLLLSPRDGRKAAAPEALRVAATRLMRSAAYRHPFYWAGFVVIGAP